MQGDKIVSGQSGWFYKLADRLKTWQAIGAGMLVLVLFAAGGLLGRGTFRPAVLVGSVGSTGAVTISAQLCLIFAYQGLYGFVYANIGLMVGLFMLGLVIGSVIIKQYVMRRVARWGHLAVVDLAMAAVLLAIPLAVRFLSSLQGSSTSQVLVHWLLMSIITITGIMGGLAFPLACQLLAQHRASQPRAAGIGAIAGQLDAAETFGSAGGALVTGVLMVPALGLTATAITLACWKLTSAATLLLVKSDPKV